jgi:hypothetical protein
MAVRLSGQAGVRVAAREWFRARQARHKRSAAAGTTFSRRFMAFNAHLDVRTVIVIDRSTTAPR